ncbi:hypothetical protein TTHT_0447 [Thermotomaculum hydrothermale]|uniref:Gingipain domain-containing protein n=1 Tax=Thermotomaculum hydrothermale TaxID=981385 RepID=A0A7R6SXZ9_9BACT|nr:C25 family cysteine peptidase [Thermotomaculum hydrothermale]BBB32041.1 hypothetical protein TTHT_0447 [Thermotomaculum hydrothermale]
MKKAILFLSFLMVSFLYAAIPQNGVELMKVDTAKNYVETRFKLPELKIKKVKTKKGEFVKIKAGDLGYSVDYGKAQLPTSSFSMVIGDTIPEVEVLSYKKETIKLDAPVFPVQKPWPKSRRIEDRPFEFDFSYYEQEKTKFNLITLGKPYIVHGKRGITITIHPFRYFPKKNELVVYKEVLLKIKNTSVDFSSTSPAFERLYSKVFLNYFKPESGKIKGKSASMGRILIITPSNYVDTLSTLITHKQSMGYDVDVFTLEDTGTTKEEIQDFISERYANANTRPDFLILVGDTADIPAFRCSTADNPYTDLYYTTVDGDDYFPDMACGRLSVSSTDELTNIINKIVYMEENIGSLEDNAVFITADDNYQITETTHNYVIENYFEPNNFNCEKIFYHTTGASVSKIANSINSGDIFVVYSGHGSPTEWFLNWDVKFSQSDVRTLLTNTIYPFVFSFACQTGDYNDYQYPECLAETWIRVTHGASAFWGSSVYSYWDEDDVLERKVFKAMFEDREYQVGPMFNAGKIYLYNYYNGGGSTLRYFQQYNLFGDPSTYTKAYKPVSKGMLFLDKEVVSCNGEVEIEVWDSDLTADTLELKIIDKQNDSSESVVLNKVDDGKYQATVSISNLFGSGSGIFEVEYVDEKYGSEGEKTIVKTVFMDCDSPYPVYFNAHYKDSHSGVVKISFNEKCSSIDLNIYKYPGNILVKELNFINSADINEIIDGLEPETEYYASISAVDEVGNSYSQEGIFLFKTISETVLQSDSCDSEDNFTHGYDSDKSDSTNGAIDAWSITSNNYATSNGTCWYGRELENTNSSYLIYGPIDLPSDGDFVLSFYHTYYFEEGYDGGLVELSIDGGNTYFDAGAYILSNGYSGSLQGGPYEGRMAFTGGGFGDLVKTVINLSPFKGKQVYVKFICTSDYSLAMDGGGWYIDDIAVSENSLPSQQIYLVAVKPDSLISILSPENTSMTADIYNSQGILIATKNFDLNANQAIHKTLNDLFEGLSLNKDLYTVVFNSSKKIAVFQMDDFTDSRGDMRDWTEACYKTNSLSAPVPHIAPEIEYWDTFIQVANVGESACNFNLAYSPLNAVIPFDNNLYNPYSSKEFDVVSSIFGNSWPDYKVNMANVLGQNDYGFVPICSTETFRVKDKDNSCKLTLEQSLSTKLYVAHIDNSDYWWTGIAIINPDMVYTAIVEIIPYDKDGNLLDGTKRYFLNPGEKYAFVTKDEFPVDAAWLEINSDIPIMGYELFGTMNRKLLTGLDLISNAAAEVLLPVVDSVNDWIGITIVNPYGIDNQVTVTGYYKAEEVFKQTIDLNAHAKWVGLLSDLFSGNVDMVKIDSQIGVVSFCLEGNGHDDSTMTKVGGVKGFKVY